MEPLGYSKHTRNNQISEFCRTLLLVVVSAFLCFLSLPNFVFKDGLGILSFISLAPLFVAVYKIKHLWTSLFMGFVYGALYFLLLCPWLYSFHTLALPLVVTLRAIQYSLIFFVLTLCTRFFKTYNCFFISSVYVVLHYLLECGFLALSYGNIAYSAYKYTHLIQVVDVFGVFGLLFIISYFSSAIAAFVISGYKRKNDLIIAIVIVVAALFYGGVKTSIKRTLPTQKEFSLIAVQHNVNSHSVDRHSYLKTLDTLVDLSNRALHEDPSSSLLVWSETAIIPPVSWFLNYPYVSEYTRVADGVVSFSSNLPIPLLFGNGDAESESDEDKWDLSKANYYNASILIDGGRIIQKYYKQHLVPFSEHFPYKNIFPHFYEFLLSNNLTFWNNGTETVVFDIPLSEDDESVKVFTPICFEDTFGYISRRGVKSGAEMIVNLTNDSWSASDVAQNQHLSAAVFRSVENSVPTVRCTNSGATCYIDNTGRILGKLDYFKATYGIYDVEIKNRILTPYTFWGDIPIIIFSLIIGVVFVYKCVKLLIKKESF